jgi:cytidylate kinase
MQNNIEDILESKLSSNIINPTPIIAIDGPSASGKGTVARRLAKHFNFNYLNSGSLYRLTAYIAKERNISHDDHQEIIKIGANLSPIFLDEKVLIDNVDVWPHISKEDVGLAAAKISPIPELREVLHSFKRSLIKDGGLVAEGRDMTSKVFIDAKIKIYLDANLEAQTKRRLRDEQEKNINTTYEELLEKIRDRDHADKNRPVGALKITEDAYYVDTSNLTQEEVFELIKNHCDKILNT